MSMLNNNIEQTKLSLVQDQPAVYTSEHVEPPPAHLVSEKVENPNRALDQVLVESAQKGDKKAFGLLVEKYHRKLGRILTRMVRDQTEVEDIVQETFIKAYRALPNFRGDSAFYTWLYRIGINTAKNHLVAMGKRPRNMTEFENEDGEFEETHQVAEADNPETTLLTKEIGITVNAAIESLPEELKVAITLREIEGLSYEEIAELMDCPIGTVRSRILDRKSTRLNSSHVKRSRMPSSA